MSRHKKAKSAQAFLLQMPIPAAPCKGLAYGPQAARRTGGQANLRFASAALGAAGPAARGGLPQSVGDILYRSILQHRPIRQQNVPVYVMPV